MKKLPILLIVLSLLQSLLSILSAQTDDMVYLSPFEVTSVEASGYHAKQTMAGTRMRTDLRDVANAVQVINSKFLRGCGFTQPNPAITLRKHADYITLRLRLVNDSRLSDLRLSEIRKTVRMALDKANANKHIVLQYERGILSDKNFRVDPRNIGNDTADFNFYVAVALTEKDSADKLTDELITFAKSLDVDGRTLIEVGKPGLSIKNAERFRMELIASIADDLSKVMATFEPDMQFSLGGLDQKLKVRALSVDEVEISLPYSFVIRSKDCPTFGN